MAEFVAVPEFVDDLFFFLIRRDLLLLGAGGTAFQIVDVGVQLLCLLVGAGPFAFQFQLLAADAANAFFLSVNLLLNRFPQLQLFLQLLLPYLLRME